MRQNLFFIFLLLYANLIFAQHQDKVDFTYADAFLSVLPSEKKLVGTVSYRFKVLSDVDSVFLDAKNMNFGYVSLNDRIAKYERTDEMIIFHHPFRANQSYTLGIGFEAQPEQTVYFVNKGVKTGADVTELIDTTPFYKQVWTQGQGKYTSHWLPSFDDMEEKIEFDLTINADVEFEVIANGRLLGKNIDGKGKLNWNFDMERPMSSYLLAFAIGNYDKQELLSKSGKPVINYFYPEDSLKVEPTYRYTKEIFDFLEDEIGVPYPWQNYKQIPVRDFLYAGMENTTATIFSDGYVIDSTAFTDKNYVNVNAHELAHQWFGNLVTEKDSGHHWLHEGFATYYAYLAEQQLFGKDHFYWKLYKSLKQLEQQTTGGEGQSLLDPTANSLTFYEKGAWALFILQNKVGDKAFKKGIKKYLKKFQFQNVTVDDFLKEMQAVSNMNLSKFRQDWLVDTEIPFEEAKSILSERSPSLKLLREMEAEFQRIQSDDIDFEKYWDATNSVHFKKHFIAQHHRILPEAVIAKAFATDTVPVRQELAVRLASIPNSLKLDFESLLKDSSYVTIENALLKLWMNYPEEKGKYLEQTKTIQGLPNKNVRLLWLILAISTNDYEARRTQEYFKELSGYTSTAYGWELRMGAFQYVNEIGFNDESLKSLMNATEHHSWQFKKFARNLIDELLKDVDYKNRIVMLSEDFKNTEIRYIKMKLD